MFVLVVLKVFSIFPLSGYIQPGKSAQLRITFHSESHPAMYNVDAKCFVTNESKMKLYRKDVEKFEKVETQRSDEFIITDKKSFARKLPTASKDETYEEWMKKFVTTIIRPLKVLYNFILLFVSEICQRRVRQEQEKETVNPNW